MPAKGTPAIDVVRRAGRRLRGPHLRARPSTTAENATSARATAWRRPRRSASTRPRMFKTLIATVDERLVAALVPVDRELDLKRLAARGRGAQGGARGSGRRRARDRVRRRRDQPARRTPARCRRSSMRRRSSTATVLVSAGRRGLQLAVAPADLVRLTGRHRRGAATRLTNVPDRCGRRSSETGLARAAILPRALPQARSPTDRPKQKTAAPTADPPVRPNFVG